MRLSKGREGIIKKIATFAPRKSGYSAVRLAHLLWEQGVGSSNLSTPTNEKGHYATGMMAFFNFEQLLNQVHERSE